MQTLHIKPSVDSCEGREFCDVRFAHFTHYLTKKLNAALHETYGDSKKEKIVFLAVWEMVFKVTAHFEQVLV